ncbi:hypothetical protein HK100_002830 [Physocladia obscura]|uniref:Uncharacterized protein n=1 Tax=Physocladia obscura TaxID=109957 RepID=A0AAD5XDY8_9FUNG|nr:hypothetical protein HK100_002830 [Physocladia obscura]
MDAADSCQCNDGASSGSISNVIETSWRTKDAELIGLGLGLEYSVSVDLTGTALNQDQDEMEVEVDGVVQHEHGYGHMVGSKGIEEIDWMEGIEEINGRGAAKGVGEPGMERLVLVAVLVLCYVVHAVSRLRRLTTKRGRLSSPLRAKIQQVYSKYPASLLQAPMPISSANTHLLSNAHTNTHILAHTHSMRSSANYVHHASAHAQPHPHAYTSSRSVNLTLNVPLRRRRRLVRHRSPSSPSSQSPSRSPSPSASRLFYAATPPIPIPSSISPRAVMRARVAFDPLTQTPPSADHISKPNLDADLTPSRNIKNKLKQLQQPSKQLLQQQQPQQHYNQSRHDHRHTQRDRHSNGNADVAGHDSEDDDDNNNHDGDDERPNKFDVSSRNLRKIPSPTHSKSPKSKSLPLSLRQTMHTLPTPPLVQQQLQHQLQQQHQQRFYIQPQSTPTASPSFSNSSNGSTIHHHHHHHHHTHTEAGVPVSTSIPSFEFPPRASSNNSLHLSSVSNSFNLDSQFSPCLNLSASKFSNSQSRTSSINGDIRSFASSKVSSTATIPFEHGEKLKDADEDDSVDNDICSGDSDSNNENHDIDSIYRKEEGHEDEFRELLNKEDEELSVAISEAISDKHSNSVLLSNSNGGNNMSSFWKRSFSRTPSVNEFVLTTNTSAPSSGIAAVESSLPSASSVPGTPKIGAQSISSAANGSVAGILPKLGLFKRKSNVDLTQATATLFSVPSPLLPPLPPPTQQSERHQQATISPSTAVATASTTAATTQSQSVAPSPAMSATSIMKGFWPLKTSRQNSPAIITADIGDDPHHHCNKFDPVTRNESDSSSKNQSNNETSAPIAFVPLLKLPTGTKKNNSKSAKKSVATGNNFDMKGGGAIQQKHQQNYVEVKAVSRFWPAPSPSSASGGPPPPPPLSTAAIAAVVKKPTNKNESPESKLSGAAVAAEPSDTGAPLQHLVTTTAQSLLENVGKQAFWGKQRSPAISYAKAVAKNGDGSDMAATASSAVAVGFRVARNAEVVAAITPTTVSMNGDDDSANWLDVDDQNQQGNASFDGENKQHSLISRFTKWQLSGTSSVGSSKEKPKYLMKHDHRPNVIPAASSSPIHSPSKFFSPRKRISNEMIQNDFTHHQKQQQLVNSVDSPPLAQFASTALSSESQTAYLRKQQQALSDMYDTPTPQFVMSDYDQWSTPQPPPITSPPPPQLLSQTHHYPQTREMHVNQIHQPRASRHHHYQQSPYRRTILEMHLDDTTNDSTAATLLELDSTNYQQLSDGSGGLGIHHHHRQFRNLVAEEDSITPYVLKSSIVGSSNGIIEPIHRPPSTTRSISSAGPPAVGSHMRKNSVASFGDNTTVNSTGSINGGVGIGGSIACDDSPLYSPFFSGLEIPRGSTASIRSSVASSFMLDDAVGGGSGSTRTVESMSSTGGGSHRSKHHHYHHHHHFYHFAPGDIAHQQQHQHSAATSTNTPTTTVASPIPAAATNASATVVVAGGEQQQRHQPLNLPLYNVQHSEELRGSFRRLRKLSHDAGLYHHQIMDVYKERGNGGVGLGGGVGGSGYGGFGAGGSNGMMMTMAGGLRSGVEALDLSEYLGFERKWKGMQLLQRGDSLGSGSGGGTGVGSRLGGNSGEIEGSDENF